MRERVYRRAHSREPFQLKMCQRASVSAARGAAVGLNKKIKKTGCIYFVIFQVHPASLSLLLAVDAGDEGKLSKSCPNLPDPFKHTKHDRALYKISEGNVKGRQVVLNIMFSSCRDVKHI